MYESYQIHANFFILLPDTHDMKSILTEAELKFLLGPTEPSKKQRKQREFLEAGKSILRSIKTFYPKKIQTYIALFLILSIVNMLDLKFLNPQHTQTYLLLFTILSNYIGLHLLHHNGTQWINTGLTSLEAGVLPSRRVYRSLLFTLSATLFLLPGLLLSFVGCLLLLPSIQNNIAGKIQHFVLRKFHSS